MARHPQALRAIVAARGRVDPGALVLRVQGWRALAQSAAAVAAVVRGKIDPHQNAAGAEIGGGSCRRSPARTRRPRMRFAYYPGCSARSTCAELNEATHQVAARLGLDAHRAGGGDLHRRPRAARHRPDRLPHAQCAHPGARRARAAAADDHLQHLHAQSARRPCRLRRRTRSWPPRSTGGSPARKACTTAAAPASAISSGCCTRTSASTRLRRRSWSSRSPGSRSRPSMAATSPARRAAMPSSTRATTSRWSGWRKCSAAGRSTTAGAPSAAASTPPPTTSGWRSSSPGSTSSRRSDERRARPW